MQQKVRRAEYPIVSPGALKSLAHAFHLLLWRIKMRASAERPQGAFTVIRNPWEKRYLQSLEYLLPQTKNAQGTALLRRVRSC